MHCSCPFCTCLESWGGGYSKLFKQKGTHESAHRIGKPLLRIDLFSVVFAIYFYAVFIHTNMELFAVEYNTYITVDNRNFAGTSCFHAMRMLSMFEKKICAKKIGCRKLLYSNNAFNCLCRPHKKLSNNSRSCYIHQKICSDIGKSIWNQRLAT